MEFFRGKTIPPLKKRKKSSLLNNSEGRVFYQNNTKVFFFFCVMISLLILAFWWAKVYPKQSFSLKDNWVTLYNDFSLIHRHCNFWLEGKTSVLLCRHANLSKRLVLSGAETLVTWVTGMTMKDPPPALSVTMARNLALTAQKWLSWTFFVMGMPSKQCSRLATLPYTFRNLELRYVGRHDICKQGWRGDRERWVKRLSYCMTVALWALLLCVSLVWSPSTLQQEQNNDVHKYCGIVA